MKRFILTVVLCLVSVVVSAQCDDPAGKTFKSGCCGEELIASFSERGGFSPVDPCACGTLTYAGYEYPYRWDEDACTVIVYDRVCGGYPLTYAIIKDGVLLPSSTPGFKVQ